MRDFPENLYDVLGISPDAAADEIRQAGRRRQRQTHPDLGGDASEFTRVRLAVEVLGNPQHRAEHDAWLAARHGIITQQRDRGARLRQQQRVPRSRPQPPSPHAHSTAAGSSDIPEFDRIPKPQVTAWRMGWYRKNWHEVPDVWPPARPLRRAASPRAIIGFVLLFIALVASNAWQLVEDSAIAAPWLPILWATTALSLLWMTVRWQGIRSQWVRMVFYAAIALAAVDAGISFVVAMTGLFNGDVTQVPGMSMRGAAMLVIAGLIPAAWWAMARHSQRNEMERILCQIANESAPPADSEQQTWGAAGATAMRNSAPGVHPVRRRFAEQIIGEQLDALTRIPGVRIVHGIRLPGSDEQVATISHAVLAGHRLALIDDQLWRPGEYRLDARGQLLRNDFGYANSAQEFPHRVAQLREFFADAAQVRGWIAVAPDALGKLELDNSRTWPNVRLVDVERLLLEVGEWLAGDGERVDRLLLRDLLELQVEPR
ncbi:J domain-containing protein [Gulosibacter bifidus]|uniref:J domain-containing protein n=1 Tax=Gulosibacter bifidus TaxID=272239 RepID=A0ABW5RJV0_9MICO|nr:DnaJ domain-containing protein [Gulosibacter bifidus]